MLMFSEKWIDGNTIRRIPRQCHRNKNEISNKLNMIRDKQKKKQKIWRQHTTKLQDVTMGHNGSICRSQQQHIFASK